MMVSLSLSIALLQSSAPDLHANAEWLKKNSTVIRTIDPNDADFKDLEPVGKAIGNARVVLLGEQSHGDGATFLAKARLIRYLHEKKGFKVLVWESGTFECERMNGAMREGLPPKKVAETGIFPIWSASPAVMPVFRYAVDTQATPNPLEMAGVDPQFSTQTSTQSFRRDLRQFLDRYHPSLLTADLEAVLGSWGSWTSPEKDGEKRKLRRAPMEALSRGLKEKPSRGAPARSSAYWIRCIENALVLESMSSKPEPKRADEMDDERDIRMGENLVWLADEYYKGKKLIVWAASFHNQFNADTIETPPGLSYRGFDTMGHTARKKLGKDIYSIGFVAYQGHFGNPFSGAQPIPTMADSSLEGMWKASGHQVAFLDMQAAPDTAFVSRPMVAAPLGYSPMKAVWRNVFDGFVFTDTMFAADSEKSIPSSYTGAGNQGSILSEVQAKLEEARKAYVTCELGFRSITDRELAAPDPSRMTLFPRADQWPSSLGTKIPAAGDFFTMKDHSVPTGEAMYVKGQFTGNLVTEGYLTLLVNGGMVDKATIVNQSYGNNLLFGDVAGTIHFDSYGTLYVKGKLSGTLKTRSYFAAYVDGDVTGSISLGSASNIYVMGRVTGTIEAKSDRAKIYIGGRMTKDDLARIKGSASVMLANTDLPEGQHKFGSVLVTVLPKK
jgi:erythromycin esterase